MYNFFIFYNICIEVNSIHAFCFILVTKYGHLLILKYSHCFIVTKNRYGHFHLPGTVSFLSKTLIFELHSELGFSRSIKLEVYSGPRDTGSGRSLSNKQLIKVKALQCPTTVYTTRSLQYSGSIGKRALVGVFPINSS